VDFNVEILQRPEQAERRLDEARQQAQRAERRLRLLCSLTVAVIAGAVVLEGRGPVAAQQSVGLPALAQRVATLELKTGPLTLEQLPGACPEVLFSGVNVRIVNGTGNTETTNRCGNLIVGYNESRPDLLGGDVRTGSHNIIVGQQNNYSSFGGLVAGFLNDSQAAYASVSGGNHNTASGNYSSVSGGNANFATGNSSSVSGGADNFAQGDASSVSGGVENAAQPSDASVSGGFFINQGNDNGWPAGSEGAALFSGTFRSP
jgi:hypothetical protein